MVNQNRTAALTALPKIQDVAGRAKSANRPAWVEDIESRIVASADAAGAQPPAAAAPAAAAADPYCNAAAAATASATSAAGATSAAAAASASAAAAATGDLFAEPRRIETFPIEDEEGPKADVGDLLLGENDLGKRCATLGRDIGDRCHGRVGAATRQQRYADGSQYWDNFLSSGSLRSLLLLRSLVTRHAGSSHALWICVNLDHPNQARQHALSS